MKNALFLPDELLLQYNFFELYPFDGGGNFIQHEIVHSLDDREITAQVLKGALADFGELENLDFQKFECWKTIEKSCWINRLYFIVSLARVARLEHKCELAELVLKIVTHFNAANPPPADRAAVQELNREVDLRRERDYNSGNAQGAIPYQWYDFQPASRIINLLNALNFLREFNLPTAEFDRQIAACARVIYEGDDEHNLNETNHQSLRGLALLYAGHYLNNPEYLRAGNVVANYHLLCDFTADGMGVDMSPSYHVFVTWISRDVARLGNIAAPGKRKLEQALRICRELVQPDWRSIVLNDGYYLDLRGFLASIGPKESNEAESRFALPDSGLAFYHTPELFVALDATKCLAEYGHFHGGKNGVTLWFAGAPILADSGCCSYDNPAFAEWFKLPQAHSSLLINGAGDGILQGRYKWSQVQPYQLGTWQGNRLTCRSKNWSRTLEIVNSQTVLIDDEVQVDENSELQFIFVLHPEVSVQLEEQRILLTNGSKRVEVTWQSDTPISWQVADGKFFIDHQIKTNRRLIAASQAAHIALQTAWHLL